MTSSWSFILQLAW